MKYLKILKKIINFKIFFLKPKNKKILVYDKASEKFAEVLFKKKILPFMKRDMKALIFLLFYLQFLKMD